MGLGHLLLLLLLLLLVTFCGQHLQARLSTGARLVTAV
jgi:hypothetical protein